MENYIKIHGQKIELTDEQVEQLKKSVDAAGTRLSDIPIGKTFKIGEHEMIVLERSGDETAVIREELLVKNKAFGENNNYDGSYVDELCNAFADEISAVIGEEKLVGHTVDLTSDDGLKDYGTISRRASLITAAAYRRYVEVLDRYKIDDWWWLATPHSTETHGSSFYAKCVSPYGYLDYCNRDYVGVRPFCILKSNIFVSK